MWVSQQDRMTVTALGAALLAGLLVFGWRQSWSPRRVMDVAAWDGRLAAARAVDVNTADIAELERLPGVGPALAGRIVAERGRGAFASPEELQRVPGIGRHVYEELKDYVTAGD